MEPTIPMAVRADLQYRTLKRVWDRLHGTDLFRAVRAYEIGAQCNVNVQPVSNYMTYYGNPIPQEIHALLMVSGIKLASTGNPRGNSAVYCYKEGNVPCEIPLTFFGEDYPFWLNFVDFYLHEFPLIPVTYQTGTEEKVLRTLLFMRKEGCDAGKNVATLRPDKVNTE